MTFSSFDAYPGLVIWHSRDLVNWQPLGPTLFTNVGSVWAPDLVKHGGPLLHLLPRRRPVSIQLRHLGRQHPRSVERADRSEDRPDRSRPRRRTRRPPLPVPQRRPDGAARRRWAVGSGHAEEGLRRVEVSRRLDRRGLRPGGAEDPQARRLLPHGARGGRHGRTADRAHDRLGALEVHRRAVGELAAQPVVRTRSAAERWWSKGHGTLVEAPDGRWFIVYHAYENGYLHARPADAARADRVDRDGWFRTAGFDPARPIPKPAGAPVPHGMAFSDDFSTRSAWASQWSFYKGSTADRARYRFENGALVLKAKGDVTRRRVAAVVRHRRPRLRDRGRDRCAIPARRPGCCSSTAAGSMPASASRRRTSSCTATAWIGRRASRPTSASGCASASATTVTS